MWFILQSLIPSFYNPFTKFVLKKPKIKYGFTSRTEFTYTAKGIESTGVRPGHFTGNEMTMFGDYTGISVIDVTIHDGVNKDCKAPDGLIDPTMFTDFFNRMTYDKRQYATMATEMAHLTGMSNATSLMYNLLRLYYIETYKHLKYDPKDTYYDNGHIKIVNTQVFTRFMDTLTLGEAVGHVPARGDFVSDPYAGDELDVPAFLWNGPLTDGMLDVLSRALGSWTATAPFGVAHDSPTLADEFKVVTSSKNPQTIGNSAVNIGVIQHVISNLVMTNRWYTDFSYAYFMLNQVMLSPVPRSAEAAAWMTGTQRVNMPKFCSITGYAPFLAAGVANARRVDWMDTYVNWQKTPGAWLYHSIALTEAAYVELANVVRADRSAEVNVYNFVDVSVDGKPAAYQGLLQDMTLIAMRYGREFDIAHATCCGLDRARDVVGLTEISVPVTVTDAEAHNFYNLATVPAVVATENVLTVNQLTSPLYPVFTYGVGNEKYYSAALEDEIVTHAAESSRDGIIFTDVVDFTRFMNIHRMMGYDVTATNIMAGKKVTNWADNASGRFLYTDLNYEDLAQVFKVERRHIVKRPNCWVNVENPVGQISLKYKMTQLQMVMYNEGAKLQPGGALISNAHVAPRPDHGSTSADTFGVRFIPIRKIEELDFRFLRLSLTSPPMTVHTSVPHQGVQPSGEEIADDETPAAVDAI